MCEQQCHLPVLCFYTCMQNHGSSLKIASGSHHLGVDYSPITTQHFPNVVQMYITDIIKCSNVTFVLYYKSRIGEKCQGFEVTENP